MPREEGRCSLDVFSTSVVPFELVKIRLQDKASAGKYTGMLDVVAKTVKNEGLLAMYQGLESTLWRHILWNAGYFGCIFQVRQMLPKADTRQGQIGNDILAGCEHVLRREPVCERGPLTRGSRRGDCRDNAEHAVVSLRPPSRPRRPGRPDGAETCHAATL